MLIKLTHGQTQSLHPCKIYQMLQPLSCMQERRILCIGTTNIVNWKKTKPDWKKTNTGDNVLEKTDPVCWKSESCVLRIRILIGGTNHVRWKNESYGLGKTNPLNWKNEECKHADEKTSFPKIFCTPSVTLQETFCKPCVTLLYPSVSLL